MSVPPSKCLPLMRRIPEPIVSSDSSAVWRIVMIHRLTSMSFVITCSCTGASLPSTTTGGSGRLSAPASARVRCVGSENPNMRSMIRMSPKRLVIARACG